MAVSRSPPLPRVKVAVAEGCVLLGTASAASNHDDMASAGATLQNYNNDLVRCIEELREKREELNRSDRKSVV